MTVGLVGAVGPPPVATALVPLLMIVGYVVLLRHLAEAQRRRTARAAPVVPAQWLPRPRVPRVPLPLPPEAAPAVVAVSAPEDPVPAVVAPEELFPYGEPWEPVPVPLPMYVAVGAHASPARGRAGSRRAPGGVDDETSTDENVPAHRRHAVGN